jgi:hypothetical protein
VAGLELDRQSGPVAIGPVLQDLLHRVVWGVQGDVGVACSVQDVDRGVHVGLPHHPARSAVKPVPVASAEPAAAVTGL